MNNISGNNLATDASVVIPKAVKISIHILYSMPCLSQRSLSFGRATSKVTLFSCYHVIRKWIKIGFV